MAKHTVILREEVSTSKGVTKKLEVDDFYIDGLVGLSNNHVFIPSGFIEFPLSDGSSILVNKHNIRSIHTKKEGTSETY